VRQSLPAAAIAHEQGLDQLQNGAMAFITLPDPADMPDAKRAVYDRFPANLTRGLLCTTTEIAYGYLDLGSAFPKSLLDPRLREMVILRVGALSRSAYERMQHIGIAHSVGVTDTEVAALAWNRADTTN